MRWYADDFAPAAVGLSRSAWVKQRQSVFARPKETVSIALQNLEVSLLEAEAGTVEQQVVFDQFYQATYHRDHGQKSMRWRWKDGKWRILSEAFTPCRTASAPDAEPCLRAQKADPAVPPN